MTRVKNVTINAATMLEGRFALCGSIGPTRYHVWINPSFELEPNAVIHANSRENGKHRTIGVNTKLGSVILASMLEQAKCCGLMEDAIAKAKVLETNRANGAAKRAKNIADKQRIYNTLIFIAKTLRNPRCSAHDDPCLIELKDKATKLLAELDL